MVNISLSRRLITLKSNLGLAATGSYEVKIAERPIIITSSVNSSGTSVSSTLSALFLAVLPQTSKTAPNSSSISSI